MNNPIRLIAPDGMHYADSTTSASIAADESRWASEKGDFFRGASNANASNAIDGISENGNSAQQQNADNNTKQTTQKGKQQTIVIKILVVDPQSGAGKDVGHTAIQIGDKVYGFYPTDVNNNGAYDPSELISSPGREDVEPRNDFNTIYKQQGYTEFTISVLPDQAKKITNYLNELTVHPPEYRLLGYQCTSVATYALGVGNVFINSWRNIPGEIVYGSWFTPAALKTALSSPNNENIVKGIKDFGGN